MRTFSRWMKPTPPLSLVVRLGGTILLAALATWLLVRYYPWSTVITAAVLGSGYLASRERAARMRSRAAAREGENLCTFVRAFPRAERDPYILRAVYDEILPHLTFGKNSVPLRHLDRLAEDLDIDVGDLEASIQSAAKRAGRVLDGCERNPFYRRIDTVADLVAFLRHQPSSIAA